MTSAPEVQLKRDQETLRTVMMDAACDGVMTVPNNEHIACGEQNKWGFIYNKNAFRKDTYYPLDQFFFVVLGLFCPFKCTFCVP